MGKLRLRMGINNESDVEATLQIGPTNKGMVRLFVQTDTTEIPFDFDPDEAEDIAAELSAAAAVARAANAPKPAKPKKKR